MAGSNNLPCSQNDNILLVRIHIVAPTSVKSGSLLSTDIVRGG